MLPLLAKGRVIRRARRADIGFGEIRIGREVEPCRTPLDTAKDQLLNGVKASSTEPDGIRDGNRDQRLIEHLHQPKHLDELALTAIAHSGFEKAAEMLELLGQSPALQRPCLIEGAGLLLDQRQVMEGITYEGAARMGPLVPGDFLSITDDNDLIDKALHHDIAEAISRRNRIAAHPVAHQRR
jgi:hypothetical protein